MANFITRENGDNLVVSLDDCGDGLVQIKINDVTVAFFDPNSGCLVLEDVFDHEVSSVAGVALVTNEDSYDENKRIKVTTCLENELTVAKKAKK